MKTKVAMAISLAGVLAAGTAAALVNTRVLNGGASGAAVLDAVQVTSTSPAAGATNPSNATVAVEPPSGAGSPTQATYAAREAGTVTLDTSNSILSIVAVTPAPGWQVVQAESDGVNGEVKFQSSTTEVEFRANLLYGIVRTDVETNDLSGGSPSITGGEGEDEGFNGNAPSRSDDDSGGDD